MKRLGLFLSTGLHDGGAFQYSQLLMEALVALPTAEYSVVVAYADPVWLQKVRSLGLEAFSVSLGQLVPAIALLPELLGARSRSWQRRVAYLHPSTAKVVSRGCDLWIFPQQDVWSTFFPVPALAAIHDLMHHYEPHFAETSSYPRLRFRHAYLGKVARDAQGVLVDSETGRRHVTETFGVSVDRLFVLPYIAHPHLVRARAPADFDRRYQLPKKFLFYPAQFWEHKNHLRLLDAMADCRQNCPDLKLVLVGSHKRKFEAVRRRMQELQLEDSVLLAGYVPQCDMAEFYRRARGLIFPTLFGPTNIPPLEAFALGCPVAASNIYGMPEQIENAGLLFNPLNTGEIASCILRLWNDDRLCEELKVRGRRKAASWGEREFQEAVNKIVRDVTSSHREVAGAPQ